MRRRQMKKQKQIIIISSLCLLLCLCVGYAAFQTTLSITAKGNVKDNSIDITDNVVTEGDGLYADSYEEGRYIYRGSNPDNYIMFNDELWRIIAKEADGTYKIIRNNSSLEYVDFDTNGHRSNTNNTFCNGVEFGCSVYAAVDGIFSSPSGSQSGTVTEDSSIKIYLNDDYYVNNINETAKGQMTSHSFNIGAIEYLNDASSDSIEKNIAGEKMYQWTGNVGLVNVSDVLKASTNPLCTSASYSHDAWDMSCNNYLFFSQSRYWTINPINVSDLWTVNSDYNFVVISNESAGYDGSSAFVRPVVFLKSDTTLNGSGTLEDPFIIV